jgi:hypothetical protein
MVALAKKGLTARNRHNPSGNDETIFLSTLEEVVETGRTPPMFCLSAITAVGRATSIGCSKSSRIDHVIVDFILGFVDPRSQTATAPLCD